MYHLTTHPASPRAPRPVRVLLFTAVPRGGGVDAVCTRLATALPSEGCAVTVLRARPAGAEHAPEPGRDIVIPALSTRFGVPTPGCGVRVAALLLRLASAIRRIRPDIVNVHFIHARTAQLFLWLRPLLGYRLVLSAHGSDILDPPEGNDRWLPRVLPGADAVVAVTEVLAEHIRAVPGVDPGRVTVIPNGVDDEFWSPRDGAHRAGGAAGAAGPTGGAGPAVVAVGELRRVKGHDVLLHAWSLLPRAEGARLVIVGDGECRNGLEQLARDLGIDASVCFTGRLPPESVRSLLRQADLFVLPSRSEGMPLALLEAMACRVPVVATMVGGVPELLEGGAGSLVRPEDHVALADAIESLLSDPAARAGMALAARERAREHSARGMVEAYTRLFTRLAPRRAAMQGASA